MRVSKLTMGQPQFAVFFSSARSCLFIAREHPNASIFCFSAARVDIVEISMAQPRAAEKQKNKDNGHVVAINRQPLAGLIQREKSHRLKLTRNALSPTSPCFHFSLWPLSFSLACVLL